MFFFSSRRRHTRCGRDWSSDVCSSDLDDHLLAGVGRIFEANGFRLRGAHEVAPEILLVAGPLGTRSPTASEAGEIEHALALLAATGPFDVGQAVILADRHVLAIEAAEGTDRMLERVATLRR